VHVTCVCARGLSFNLHISTNALIMSFLPCVSVIVPFLRFELLKFADPFSRFLFAIVTGVLVLSFGLGFRFSVFGFLRAM
jgi:hypothetical protein